MTTDDFNYEVFDREGNIVQGQRTPDEIVGERVHLLMRRTGRHQKMLASYMNVTQATVSNKLRGARPWTLSDLVKVAEFLGVELSDLVDEVPLARPKGFEPLTFWLGASERHLSVVRDAQDAA